MSNQMFSDKDIDDAFLGTDFGGCDKRQLLSQSVLKVSFNYHCGYTITKIMEELKLISGNGRVLKKGIELLRESYSYLCKNGA